ncbi:MAG: Smr/MutS family protein [Rectinemataceae bacterium]|nr:Smr/MutS family protein [Rectinemataceae bacterium]
MFLNNEHSLKLLDFFRMRERTSEYCLSWEGGELLRSSFPIDDKPSLEQFKMELAVLVDHLDSAELPGFSFPLIEMPLKHLGAAGFTLELEEFFALGLWAKEFDKVLVFLSKARFTASKREQESQPEAVEHQGGFDPEALASKWAIPEAFRLIEEAPKLQHVYKTIFEILTPDGEMRDLPEIKQIRDAISRATRDLLTIADSYKNDPDLRQALQSGEPTQRDGRTVLAVRANFRGRVKGIVHEVSSTGQTVFIEPAALVRKNNDLVQLEAKLRAEIFRILKELTAELRKDRHSIAEARVTLAFLDQRLARAVQIRREELILPEIRDSGYTIWRARHPLLGKKAVPIDVDMPESARTLIVTGPNTGGKTVTLKTIGLFALMHQFGMGIPAALGTKLPVFDAVLADIGDEQSIDQSLSTFSGHMRVMAEIVKHATRKSLVLLDELGAGTDPEEGCAIAMGLLDFFIERGCLTMATTHHGILKNYGYTRPGCLNASMEFDSTRLAPTYRIVMGIPGESRALEIAAQIGLVGDIVARARRYLSDERTDIGELIRGLNEKHRELESLEREQKKRLKSATEDQRKADLAALRVRQRETELRRHGLGELKILLGESRKTLENLVREVRESGASSDKTKDVKKFLAELSDSVERQYGILEKEGNEARLDFNVGGSGEATELTEVQAEEGATPSLVEGAEVVYGPQRKRARLIRKASGSTWIIEIGSVRLKVSAADLLPAQAARIDRPAYDVELARGSDENTARASFELNLRGFRLAEALAAVERQIDLASLQGLSLFSIIHGTGEGVLGKGIHDYLRSSPVVEDYHFARPEEGGYGKTIVRLKV